jgi:hypothetical protein
MVKVESEYKSENSFVSVSQEQDTSKNKPEENNIDESESLNFDILESDNMLMEEGLFQELQILRETLTARQQEKHEITFKEKLGQIFKTRN